MSIVRIITPMKQPGRVARDIFVQEEEGSGEVAILDLSAGQLNAPGVLGGDVRAAARRKGMTWLDGQRYATEVGDASREAYLKWLSQMSNTELAGGKSIKEWFTYRRELSLWWLRAMSVKHPSRHPYRWLFYMIFVIEHLATSKSAPSSWQLWVEDAATGRALQAAVRRHACVPVRVRVASSVLRGDQTAGPGTPPLGLRIRSAFRDALKAAGRLWQPLRAALFSSRTLRPRQKDLDQGERSEKPLVLVQTYFPQSWLEDSASGSPDRKAECTDHYFGDAPWRLQAHGFHVAWLPRLRSRDYGRWEERGEQSLLDASPWMTLSWRKLPGLYAHLVKCAVLYLWLFQIKKIHRSWQYEGIPLGHWLKNEYAVACWFTRPLVEFEAYRSACEALKPDAVLYRDEFYSSGRRLAAAASGTTKLVGMQHGMISRDHTVYQFRPEDLQTGPGGELASSTEKPANHVHHCPVPDAFASFGTYYRELFEQWGGYPAGRVVPTGGLRHDALFDRFLRDEETRRSRRDDLRQTLGLPRDEQVVLLCTGRAAFAGEWFEMVLASLEEAGLSAFVAVKTHQFHGGESYVRNAADAREFERYSIFQHSVYELIFCADVLVMSTSTTALEARLLRTPVVPIVADASYESYPFSKEHLGEPVTGYTEMAEVLRDALLRRGGFSPEYLRENRCRVLERHLHNEDGKACHRLANLIWAGTHPDPAPAAVNDNTPSSKHVEESSARCHVSR